ncbi:DUF3048 domain-containing protein [Peribacillus asahii]|uniref:DUF3048 domain-containing protein n=1 Tax=Peribacillus asahii TaxID=228899 RepID=UPI0037F62F93
MMKRNIVLCLLVAGVLITGCSKKEEVQEPVPVEEDVPKEEAEAPEFVHTYPLTGVGTNDSIDQRAVAVMVNNHTKARPQSGLTKADIVYEMLAEGEVTRLLAVYQSEKPEQVGPIRSARDYYIELAKGLDCIYVCHGNSPDAESMLKQGYIDHLNGLYYDGTLFKRSSERKAPHNSYISFENIEKGAMEKGYNLTGAPASFVFLNKEEIKRLEGDSVTKVSINYGFPAYNTQFEYDVQQGKYKRYSNGEQTKEATTSVPVLVDNVLIIETAHRVIDKVGRRDIDLQSGGKGYLLQKGKVKEVEWINKDGRIVPVSNGIDVGLIPGKTWVNIIPNQPGLTQNVTLNAAGN